MELKLYLQQTPQYNINQQQIHYAGNNPQSLGVVIGELPASRQWPNYNSYIEVTSDVSDIFKLKLTWTNDRDANGISTPGVFQPKKGVSGTLTFEGETYKLIKAWLVDDVSAPLNSVSARIEHVGCGNFEEYTFKAAELRWCEGDICTFDVTLKQKDTALDCVRKTLIADNHLGWFSSSNPQKKHPRFSYCNEQRPNGMLVGMWWFMGVTAAMFFPLVFAIVGVMNSVIFAINGIMLIIQGIIAALQSIGIGKNWNTPNLIQPINPSDLFDGFANYFVEIAGCGREHPAPLIRDYIYNVCEKCKLDVGALPVTAPVFFAETMPVETSARGVQQMDNPHYNACYMYAPLQRGIRRVTSNSPFGLNLNAYDWYIPDNAPLLMLDQFLDQLKTLYNAEWRVVNNKLYFQRKDFFINGSYVLDFTENSADRQLLLEGICFEWNERKYPAYTEGLYSNDPVDTCGNEALKHMNGIISHGNTDENPGFDGMLDKKAQFGATKFRLDGVSEDYIYDAMQVSINGSVFTPFMAGLFIDFIAPYFIKYSDYGLLLKDEIFNMPKVLIWDGVSYDNAKAQKNYSAWTIANFSMPAPNTDPRYGTNVTVTLPHWAGFGGSQQTGNTWHFKHVPETFVRGSKLTFPPFYPGYYTITDIFGVKEIKMPAMLVNYPMYFEPGFEDTMWDWFHWIDDPLRNPTLNMNFTAKVELCCDTLEKLGVFKDASGIVLGEKIKLPNKYFTDGKIKEIEVSYDTQNETGQYIQIRGTL